MDCPIVTNNTSARQRPQKAGVKLVPRSRGGSSSIDSLILRDRRTSEEDEFDERRYYCLNQRHDISVILTEDGSLVEWIKYTPYGEPITIPAGDTKRGGGDFAWDSTDESNITGGGGYDVRKDANLDGVVNASDVTHANSITGGYQTLGRGVLSSQGVQNRIGYAGYRYDHHLVGAGKHLYHVRHRVYQAEIGRWATMDFLGYVQGMNLYQYVLSQPILRTDPSGLLSPPPSGSLEHGCGSGCASNVQSGPLASLWTGIPPECPVAEKKDDEIVIPIPRSPPWTPPPGQPRPPRYDPDWITCADACDYTRKLWTAACATCTRAPQVCIKSADASHKACLVNCLMRDDKDFRPPDAMWDHMCKALARCGAAIRCGTPVPRRLLPPDLQPRGGGTPGIAQD